MNTSELNKTNKWKKKNTEKEKSQTEGIGVRDLLLSYSGIL